MCCAKESDMRIRYVIRVVTSVLLLAITDPLYSQEASKPFEFLVIGGRPASASEFPEVVTVHLSGGRFCSGVLVATTAVLTAAHCLFDGAVPERVTSGNIFDSLSDKEGASNSKYQAIQVGSYVPMTKDSIDTRQIRGVDLMIIKLSAPFKKPAVPVTIPSIDDISSAKFVRVVGFGKIDSGATGRKFYGDMPVKAARCNPSTEPRGSLGALCAAGAEMFASDPDFRVDTCPGDSGGPAYVRNVGGEYRLVGIISRSPLHSTQCRAGTFITLLDGDRLDWLKNQVHISAPVGTLMPEAPPTAQPHPKGGAKG